MAWIIVLGILVVGIILFAIFALPKPAPCCECKDKCGEDCPCAGECGTQCILCYPPRPPIYPPIR